MEEGGEGLELEGEGVVLEGELLELLFEDGVLGGGGEREGGGGCWGLHGIIIFVK